MGSQVEPSTGGLTAPVDAADIADGSVSSTEFQYLDGVTSDLQTQLASKVDISGTPSAGNYARWSDADTLEARTTAQVLSDIGAPDITGTPVANQMATWSDANTLQGLSGVYLAHLSHAAYTNGELITLPFAASGGAADGEYYIRVVRRAVGGTTGSAQDISFAIAADVVSGTPYTSSMGPSTPFIVRIAISGGYVCLHLANTSAADLYLQVFTNADSPAGAFSISDVASTGTAATSQNSSADTVAIEAETLFRSRADSTRWYVQGGIGAGKDYGSYIELNANTGPRTGSLLLASGDVANGAIILRSGNNLDCLTINRDGTVTLHATTLASLVGSMKLDDLATPDDNTDLNASTTRHGLLPKLSNVATEFLNGVGAWATPAGASFVGASAYKNANQTITAQTWTAITLPAENFDSGTIHSTSSNTGRFTVPTTGYYLVAANVGRFGGAEDVTLKVYINGVKADTYGITSFEIVNGYNGLTYVSVIPLTAGDYVEMYIQTYATEDIVYDVNTTAATFYTQGVTCVSVIKVG